MKAALDSLVTLIDAGGTVEAVLKHLREAQLVALYDDLETAITGPVAAADPGSSEAAQQAFMAQLLAVPYVQVSRYRAVLESSMPFSTKHGVKGAEFQNVVVVLDDAGANWNQYSFTKLLAGTDTSESREKRTRNLFYVCCSRAKDKLIVADLGLDLSQKSKHCLVLAQSQCE